LAGLGPALGRHTAALDGEIVAINEHERPYYLRLASRMHLKNPALLAARTKSTPVDYMVFDLLHLDGHSTRELPYVERRWLLEGLKLQAPAATVPEKERAVAEQLIEALASDFEPTRYKDEYRDQVRVLLAKKAKGKVIAPPAPPQEEPGEVIDLLAALEASVRQARQAKERSAEPHEQTGTRHRRRA
jgi:hypothetical protein